MATRAHRFAIVLLSAGTLAAGTTAPAAADAPGEEGQPTNFGQCVAFEARDSPPGPEHGRDLSLARSFNPSGLDIECTKLGRVSA